MSKLSEYSSRILKISGDNFPEYSAMRGIKQSIDLDVGKGHALHRTVNGELLSTSLRLSPKYKTTIIGTDTFPPAISNLYVGRKLTISCIEVVGQVVTLNTGTKSLSLDRKPALNSCGTIVSNDGTYSANVNFTNGLVVINESVLNTINYSDIATIHYQPELEMLVESWTCESVEWNKSRHWTIKLLEV